MLWWICNRFFLSFRKVSRIIQWQYYNGFCTYLINSSSAMRLELIGVSLGPFHSIFTPQSSVRMFSWLLWYNNNDSSFFLPQVLNIVLNNMRFKIWISRAHSKQYYTVARHHILACLKNEAFSKLNKVKHHFNLRGYFSGRKKWSKLISSSQSAWKHAAQGKHCGFYASLAINN